MRVLSLFSGIGAFEKALANMGIPFELVGFSEIDKYAVRSYCAIHGVSEEMNLGDITQIDEKKLPKDIDIVTYGFPCQDISVAGKQKGLLNTDGTQTRSGLFFEALRIIEATQPRVAIAENVKNLTGKKFKEQFLTVLESLENAGYNNYWKVLNAKDYGIPQNRERVFIISIRKDIDVGLFRFPEPIPLTLKLKDLLEDDVDEKYYLEGKYESLTKINDNYSIMNGGTIGKMHDISRRAYNENGTSPTIPTCGGGNIHPKVVIAASRGRNPQNPSDRTAGIPLEQMLEPNTQGICNTLTTVLKDNLVVTTEYRGEKMRIRKLTPKECYRLMGFSDADYEKASAVNSNTQLYKQAGNSIVVNVLETIFESLYGKDVGIMEEMQDEDND